MANNGRSLVEFHGVLWYQTAPKDHWRRNYQLSQLFTNPSWKTMIAQLVILFRVWLARIGHGPGVLVSLLWWYLVEIIFTWKSPDESTTNLWLKNESVLFVWCSGQWRICFRLQKIDGGSADFSWFKLLWFFWWSSLSPFSVASQQNSGGRS